MSTWQLDPVVAAVLRHVFPPSSHACYGLDDAVRTCHFSHVVAYQSKFYHVSDSPQAGDEQGMFVWLASGAASKQPLEYIR